MRFLTVLFFFSVAIPAVAGNSVNVTPHAGLSAASSSVIASQVPGGADSNGLSPQLGLTFVSGQAAALNPFGVSSGNLPMLGNLLSNTSAISAGTVGVAVPKNPFLKLSNLSCPTSADATVDTWAASGVTVESNQSIALTTVFTNAPITTDQQAGDFLYEGYNNVSQLNNTGLDTLNTVSSGSYLRLQLAIWHFDDNNNPIIDMVSDYVECSN